MASRTLAPTAGLGGTARHSLLGVVRSGGSVPQIDRFGWMPGKREVIERRFRELTLSVILAGRGSCVWQGRRSVVRAPCLFLFRAGEHAAYGPEETWDEAFVAWRRPVEPAVLGLAAVAGVQALEAPRLCAAWFALLLRLAAALPAPGAALQCDLAAAGLARAAAGGEPKGLPLGPAARVAAAADELRRRLDEEPDLAALARRHGFSPSQLRRAWCRHLGTPPTAWLAGLREARAEELLRGGDAPVAAVARACGFPDRRRFTRWFRRRTGTAPSGLRSART